MVKYVLALFVFVAVLAVIFVRLAPFDAARFHKPSFPAAAGDYANSNGFQAVRALTAEADDVVQALDQAILATPRTKRMAGLPGMDLITYESRSLLFGFPDYTNVSIISAGTVGNDGPLLSIRSQARFGMSDLGVNKARVEDWLTAIDTLVVKP